MNLQVSCSAYACPTTHNYHACPTIMSSYRYPALHNLPMPAQLSHPALHIHLKFPSEIKVTEETFMAYTSEAQAHDYFHEYSMRPLESKIINR